MNASPFNFGIFTLVGVIMLVLSSTSCAYLFGLKNKSEASRMLMWFFACVIASGAATLLTNLGTSWAWAFAPAQDAFLILGGVSLVRFAYIYPVDDQPREARWAFALYLALALFALGYAAVFGVRYLASLPEDLQENQAFYLLTPLMLLLVVGIYFRRYLHWRRPLFRAGSSGHSHAPDDFEYDRGWELHAAYALRNFGIALSLGLVPVVALLVKPYLPAVLASFLFNFGVVLAISAVMLVYLSHAPDPTTISARLVGITLATVMLILGLAAVWFSLTAPAEQVSTIVLTFIIFVLFSWLLILVVFPLFFRYTLLRPLDRLLAGIRRANDGDLETRVALQFEDEIGFLTRSFNRMVQTLNENSQALQSAAEQLEHQVIERTTELKASNQGLRVQNRYQQALAGCSRVFLQPAATREERVALLNQAMSHLLEAVQASRAYIFQNGLDLSGEETVSMLAETVAPGVSAQLPVNANQNVAWATLPAEMYAALSERQPYGGPVEISFASAPMYQQAFLNQQPPLLSFQSFPIHLFDEWWGFIGFDDCEQPRLWQEDEIQVLRTGAEMLVSVLLRWQREDDRQLRARAQEALAEASRHLLQPVENEIDRQAALSSALGYLVQAASASRGYLFENVEHPQDGFSLQLVAAAAAPDVEAHLGGPFAAHVPWNLISTETRTSLEEGLLVDGPFERVLSGSPFLQDALASDPAVSILLYPIFFGKQWWGIVGFDDFDQVRVWGEPEVLLLRTGAEILSQTMQRWVSDGKLQNTLNVLEERVQQRTHQLSMSNTRLLGEIDERRLAEQNLQKQLKMELVLAGISTDLMNATDQDSAIDLALTGLGDLFQPRSLRLVLLVERQEFIVAEVYSWLSPQAKPFSIEDAQILLNSFVWSTVQLARHEPVYLHVAQSLPPAAAAELSHLHTHNLQSLYLMPLVAQNLLIGVLIFENISTAETVFTETRRLLEVAAGILSSALAHQQLLRELEQKINLRTRELAALYDLAILGSRSASLSDVLLPMLSRILEITASDAVCLHSLSEDGLRLVVHLGMNADQLAQHEHIPLTPKLKRWFYAKNGSTVDPGRTKSQPTPAAFALPDFPQLRLIRLQVHERVLGLLCCYRRSSVPYNPHEISTLATIGEQLGVIIENYRLRLEAEAFAGLRERQRLARELHDSVSQSLYSVTLFARAGQDALEADDLQKLTQTLGEVESNAKSALRAMRLLLYELRTEEISGGLKRALIERFHMVENRLGVRTELDIDDTLYLEPKAEREMFWLVTEALNNVVKHAEAQHVFVSLRRTPAGMELAIVDDGLGFDLHQAPAGIGLSSMRERASLLGGALEVRSQPGAGTQVRMEIPFDLASRGD